MACPDTQIFLGFFSTASPEWLRTCPEGNTNILVLVQLPY